MKNEMLLKDRNEETQLNAFNVKYLSRIELAVLAYSEYESVRIKVAEHAKTDKNTILTLLNNSDSLSIITACIRNTNVDLTQEDFEYILDKYYLECMSIHIIIYNEIAKRKKNLRFKKIVNFFN